MYGKMTLMIVLIFKSTRVVAIVKLFKEKNYIFMNRKVFVSCAVTGSGDTAKKHPDLPKTPEQIAKAAIEAAKAGAAIAHIHVREPDGKPSRKIELYKEVVDRVRSSGTDVVLNLTTGWGESKKWDQEKIPLMLVLTPIWQTLWKE